MNKIKYTSKNGYTGVMYGKSSLAILDINGKGVKAETREKTALNMRLRSTETEGKEMSNGQTTSN